jgi:hypothetical protein
MAISPPQGRIEKAQADTCARDRFFFTFVAAFRAGNEFTNRLKTKYYGI